MAGRGYPLQPASASSTLPAHIPSDLSCIVLYEPLKPDYKQQPDRRQTEGNKFWAPPNKKNALVRGAGAKMFRWKGGQVTDITSDISKRNTFTRHSVATLFTQYPDTDHLFAVAFDAQKKHVVEDYGGWKVLSFHHVPQAGTHRTYSSIEVAGDCQQLAAPGSRDWMPQLVPGIYNFNTNQASHQAVSAGLIGYLPILFALPAFSARPELLASVLTRHMAANRWIHHTHPDGWIAERGMVVTVYLDPSNKQGSTAKLLDLLQQGRFGPFYQP
ncbi:MAG: hypothetical protein Q9170_008125 [Blastenia crenularia]